MINDKDMVELSTLHAYKYYKEGESFEVNGNSYYVIDTYNEHDGMNHGTDAMLVQNDSNEYALIYTGSDKRNDFVNDWVLNNGRNLFKINPPQYEEGLNLYNQLSKSYNISRVGGVSLGGGVATYVGIFNQDVSVVSVNPSPQTFEIDKEYSNIITVIEKNDVLFNAASHTGRRNNYTKTIQFFDRGNNFFSNIKLNHIGYDKSLGFYLDDAIPFDLLTGNFTSNYIDVNAEDITMINNNLSLYIKNQDHELSVAVTPNLYENVSCYRNEASYQGLMNSIIDQVHLYMVKSLPTLNSYFEFSHFFDEIKGLINNQNYDILDSILNKVVCELNLNAVSDQIYIDSKNAIRNIAEINNFIENTTSSCNKLINNIELKDQYLNASSTVYLDLVNLASNKNSTKLTYFILVEYAKDIIYMYLRNIITNKFSVIDAKIDAVIYTLKTIVGGFGDIVSLVSREVSQKIDVIEQILRELYVFDIGDAVYNMLIICIDEIISIVLPKDLDKKLGSFKYLSKIFNNSSVTYENYIEYLKSYSSNGIGQITNNFNGFYNYFKVYKNYLNNTYN